jgi:hypothetical protein
MAQIFPITPKVNILAEETGVVLGTKLGVEKFVLFPSKLKKSFFVLFSRLFTDMFFY